MQGHDLRLLSAGQRMFSDLVSPLTPNLCSARALREQDNVTSNDQIDPESNKYKRKLKNFI